MSRGIHVVVPARYASTRLPGKPLADIAGKPMIVRVLDQVSRSQAHDCVAAVDDARVYDAVCEAGYQAIMTAQDHPSGSDRVMEVAASLQWPDDDLVINVQGDEPLLPPAIINSLIEAFAKDAGVQIATMCEQLTDSEQIVDPNVVKVVRDVQGYGLYFSRATIPFARDHKTAATYYRHIGLYGFSVAALRRVTNLSVSELEQVEVLEQLRWLENGERIYVATATTKLPGGVDTPADLERVRAMLQSTVD